MARPSKYGEPTTAIRVPESKLSLIQQALDQGFVQNPEGPDDAFLEEMVQKTLARCEEVGASPRKLLLHLIFRDLCEKLDRFPEPDQHEFVARICARYLVGDK